MQTEEVYEARGALAKRGYRFSKIIPSKLDVLWPFLKIGIAQAFQQQEPVEEKVFANIQKALLAEQMYSWVLTSRKDGRGEIVGFVLGTVAEAGVETEKIFFIYSLANFGPQESWLWEECFARLAQFAKAKGCGKIQGATDNVKLAKVARDALGAKVRFLVEIKI